MKIQRNKNPAGRISNIGFGLCSIADGLTRVVSLGFLHSTFTLDYSRRQARMHIQKLKAARADAKQILQDAGTEYDA